jgi:hypothetical protein
MKSPQWLESNATEQFRQAIIGSQIIKAGIGDKVVQKDRAFIHGFFQPRVRQKGLPGARLILSELGKRGEDLSYCGAVRSLRQIANRERWLPSVNNPQITQINRNDGVKTASICPC